MLEMENFLKEFGKQLKTTRKHMGLSQVTAAQNMRIDYRHYQNIEGGKINLRLDTLIKLVKFYNMDRVNRPFNMEACMDLLAGQAQLEPGSVAGTTDNFAMLYHHFVDTGHAGYITVNCRSKMIDSVNAKLFQSLGYRSAQELTGRSVQTLLVPESAAQVEELMRNHDAEHVSKPFVVTFRTQPPAYPIPMMAVVRAKKDNSTGEGVLHCIFFDRRTLEEEGHRLKEILSGYQQFMELYPQLKAV